MLYQQELPAHETDIKVKGHDGYLYRAVDSTGSDHRRAKMPAGLAVADFNGDGRPDLAVANNFPGGTVSILLGNGDGGIRCRDACVR